MANRNDSRTNWGDLYRELMQSLALTPEEHEKRKYPRILLPPGIELFVEIGKERYKVLDIPPGGISLVSQNPLSGSSEVNIVYDDTFKLISKIVYSRVDPTMGANAEGGYRVGAKFLEEDEGYRIMVMVLQYYGSRLSDSVKTT